MHPHKFYNITVSHLLTFWIFGIGLWFDEECVAVASVLSLQAPGVFCTELDAPQPNRLVADRYTSFGQKILNEWSGTPGAW